MQPPPNSLIIMNSKTKIIPIGLALLCACLPLFGWWMTGLFDIDEGFYGAVVAEMNRRGEWITPYFNGHPWFEKPILLYWLAKPCMMLLGPDFGPRLPSVLCTIALFIVSGYFVKKRYGPAAQSFTIICLGTSVLVLGLGRQMMTDAALNLALTTAFLSFYESLVGDRRWRVLTAFCLGVGVLAKGPVALILFVLVAAVALWRDKTIRDQIKGYWLVGTAVLAATIAAWYVPCYLANGQVFVQKFLIEQNIGRFLGGDKAHSIGLIGLPVYIPVIFLAVCPWGWIERKAFTKANVDDSYARYLATWAIVIFVFFSISGAKLVHYVLPVIPPLAILAAKKMTFQPKFAWKPERIMGISLFLLLILNPIQRYVYVRTGQQEAHYLVRKHPEIQVLFQIGRRESELNTGTTKLNETSLPSLIMYLNKEIVQTDDERLVFDVGIPVTDIQIKRSYKLKPGESYPPILARWLFTRKSRLASLAANHKLRTIEETENFGVYEIRYGLN